MVIFAVYNKLTKIEIYYLFSGLSGSDLLTLGC